VSAAWQRLGLRGRLALAIGAIVLAAFTVLFVAVRIEMNHESTVIHREEGREAGDQSVAGGEGGGEGSLSPIADAQDDVEKTLLIAAIGTLAAALLAGYLVASRTAAPLRRLAHTAAAVDAGDLTPRTGGEPAAAVEVQVLAEALDHMLDRLDDAFSRQRRFVADASHELRTPLTAIRGQLEVLARSERVEPGELRRVETLVLEQMTRIEALVDDLLALARLDEGPAPVREPIDVATFLDRLAATDPGWGVVVGALPAGRISGDPEQLSRAIGNLLANARRYAGPEGRVELGAEADAGVLVVHVDDDGPGIAVAERERVFDRFHRSGSARDRGSGGSGLGLAISRAVAESQGGTIGAEDSPLGGARIVLRLPGFVTPRPAP
jgi:signal transduction histidine kinase